MLSDFGCSVSHLQEDLRREFPTLAALLPLRPSSAAPTAALAATTEKGEEVSAQLAKTCNNVPPTFSDNSLGLRLRTPFRLLRGVTWAQLDEHLNLLLLDKYLLKLLGLLQLLSLMKLGGSCDGVKVRGLQQRGLCGRLV